jgi:flagellar hook-associated protein 1 FlgK
MSISHSLDTARSALAIATERSAIVARNISHAGIPGSSRKIVTLTTGDGNAPRISGIDRSVPPALLDRVVSAQSDAARNSIVSSALEELQVIGDPQSGSAVGGRLSVFQVLLSTYSARPADMTAATGVLAAAADVVTSLHRGSQIIAEVRASANENMAIAVGDLAANLARIAVLDATVTQGVRRGVDVTDDLDARDQVMLRIADMIGLTVVQRPDQGVSLYTESGVPLYDGIVRSVELAEGDMVAGRPGPVLLVDGVPASGPEARISIASGKLAGLLRVRDEISMTYASQYDEIARGLVTVFAEGDQSVPANLPEAAGLFRIGATADVPGPGMLSAGAAIALQINPRVDPRQGGDISRLRDGGISSADPRYIYNEGTQSGYVDRIIEMAGRLSVGLATAPEAELPGVASVSDLAASSSGWLQGLRKLWSEETDYSLAVLDRASGTLDQMAGINIDDQILQLMELQKSYQASSKLISTVDAMFDALLLAVR